MSYIHPTTLIVYPDNTGEGVAFECANAFISRVVGFIAEHNLNDADAACRMLSNFEHLLDAVKRLVGIHNEDDIGAVLAAVRAVAIQRGRL